MHGWVPSLLVNGGRQAALKQYFACSFLFDADKMHLYLKSLIQFRSDRQMARCGLVPLADCAARLRYLRCI
jgi:hypothetical protein